MKENTRTRRIATQLKLRPMEIRRIQRVFSIALLIAIALVISSNFWSEIRFASPNEQGANRLIIVLERDFHVGVDDLKYLTIKAVDQNGAVDKSRNDLVQLNLTSLSQIHTSTKLSVNELRLENGSANVSISGPVADLVKVTVSWKEGRSRLEPGETLVQVFYDR